MFIKRLLRFGSSGFRGRRRPSRGSCPAALFCRFAPALILAALMHAPAWSSQAAVQVYRTRVKAAESAADLSREECLELARSNRMHKDLKGAKLNDTDLSNAVMLSADLRGANLKKTILTKAKLCRANLSFADMEGALLNEADLSWATLVNTKLKKANLMRATLCDANLMGADLTGAILTETDLAGANLTGANLAQANLAQANLTGANLHGAVLSKTNQLDQAVLSQTILPDGTLHP